MASAIGPNRLVQLAMFMYVLGAQSCLTLVTTWTVAYQPPLSMEFSRQEYWSGLSFSSPGDRPNPGIKLGSPALQVDSLLTELHTIPGLQMGRKLHCNDLRQE